MALSLEKEFSYKGSFNAILVQLFGSEFTIESHNCELEGATLCTIQFKSVLLDTNATCWMEQSIYCLFCLSSISCMFDGSAQCTAKELFKEQPNFALLHRKPLC